MNYLYEGAKEFINLAKGDDLTQLLQLLQNDVCIDITGATQISMNFANQDQSVLTKTLTGGGITIQNAMQGKINLILSAAESALLAECNLIDMFAVVALAGKTQTYIFKEALTIYSRKP